MILVLQINVDNKWKSAWNATVTTPPHVRERVRNVLGSCLALGEMYVDAKLGLVFVVTFWAGHPWLCSS